MKDLIDWAEIWVRHFPSKQNLTLETLLQARITCDVRKNGLQRHMDTLQKAILYFINLTHPTPRDKSDNHKTVEKNLTNLELASAVLVRSDSAIAGSAIGKTICSRVAEKIQGRMLEKTSSTCILA